MIGEHRQHQAGNTCAQIVQGRALSLSLHGVGAMLGISTNSETGGFPTVCSTTVFTCPSCAVMCKNLPPSTLLRPAPQPRHVVTDGAAWARGSTASACWPPCVAAPPSTLSEACV
jgi:hypothetical protein